MVRGLQYLRLPALFTVLLLLATSASADNILMTRSYLPFEIAMEETQSLLDEYGYTVAHTQRCDGGLTDFGYKSDYYRVIFFGKIDEVRELSANHPELVPFLPLKMLLFAENEETVLVALDPQTLSPFIDDSEVKIQLRRWQNDILSIFNEMREKTYTPPPAADSEAAAAS